MEGLPVVDGVDGDGSQGCEGTLWKWGETDVQAGLCGGIEVAAVDAPAEDDGSAGVGKGRKGEEGWVTVGGVEIEGAGTAVGF